MDWRLIAAVAAAGGSFCVVGVGAYVMLTASPALQRASAPAPALPFEERFSAIVTPSMTMQGEPDQTSPDETFSQTSSGPFAARDVSPSSASAAAAAPGLVDTPAPPLNPDPLLRGRPEPRLETRKGAETAALGLEPDDDVARREPPRPVIGAKKAAVVPGLQTAPPVSRHRGVLTSAEIFRIKRNLRLTPEQEPAWPAVEAALTEMGRQQIVLIRQGQEPRLSPDDWPPGRLYAIAGPLLQTLRPDQKETVRKVCRSLGFENVASML